MGEKGEHLENNGPGREIQRLLDAREKNAVKMVNSTKEQTPMSTSKWAALLLSVVLLVGLFLFLSSRPTRHVQEKRKGAYPSVLSSSRGGKGAKRSYTFPIHWGKPEEGLLYGGHNEVRLPAGYGMGSLGLGEWIQGKIEEDSRILQEIHKRSGRVE